MCYFNTMHLSVNVLLRTLTCLFMHIFNISLMLIKPSVVNKTCYINVENIRYYFSSVITESKEIQVNTHEFTKAK